MIRFSCTERLVKTRRPSGTVAMPISTRLCAGIWSMGWPSKRMRPRLGMSVPQIILSSVLLPAPLAPMQANISPWLDLQVDVVESLEVLVVGAGVLDLKQAHAGVPPM